MIPTNTQSQDIRYGVASSSQDINRLAIKLKDKCTYSKRVKGNFFSYLLDLKEVSTFSGASSYIKRFSMGNPDLEMTSAASKTILLTGATGSGKTTWINAMVNYVLGVEWDDPFRFILVDEDVRGGSQANSQTQGVTAYDLHHQNGFRIPFSLTIVDTPGFGDTGGIARDKEITSAIEKLFKHKNGIEVHFSTISLLFSMHNNSITNDVSIFINQGIGCSWLRREII
jgi:GTP-binding protein EngB required for normal cell division